MTELLEIHILQNFAPSNLNRDDTGSPKDCVFGGARRARVSSQAFKRAMRTYVRERQLLGPENLAQRSRRFNHELVNRLVAGGRGKEEAQEVVKLALETIGFKLDSKDDHTQYLIFLGSGELDDIAELVEANWDEIRTVVEKRKASKKDKKEAVSPDLKKALDRAIRQRDEGGDAVDVALFGRMLADRPDKNQDAACQVAHAISTHKVQKEFDYYTAVDELKKGDEDAGAGMVGTTEFNSACFYRYLLIDLEQLRTNLQDDHELFRKGLLAFTEAAVRALPTGKQNSFAAHNPPSFVALRHRKDGAPINLANAFETPVWSAKTSLSAASAERLSEQWKKLDDFYGGSSNTIYWSLENGFTHGDQVNSLADMLGRLSAWVGNS